MKIWEYYSLIIIKKEKSLFFKNLELLRTVKKLEYFYS